MLVVPVKVTVYNVKKLSLFERGVGVEERRRERVSERKGEQ